MSRRGENIFKRKDGRWEGRYICGRKLDGTAVYKSVYARCYADCSKKLSLAKSGITSCANPICFAELFDIWLLSRKNAVKLSTYSSYESLFENYLQKPLGSVRIDRLDKQTLDRYADELLTCGGRNGQGLSAATVQSVIILLRAVLEYGECEFGLVNNAKKLSLPKSDPKDISVFTVEEMQMIRSNALYGNSYELGILLALYTGLRIGELCALKWENIDLSACLVHVGKTLTRVRNYENDSSKTIMLLDMPKSKNSVRDVPIPPFMQRPLARLKRTQNDENYFLTCSPRFTEPRTYTMRYKTFLKRLHIPYHTFHSLRHTFATECVKRQIDVKTVSELLGHSSVKITLERYVHPDMESKRRQLQKLYKD